MLERVGKERGDRVEEECAADGGCCWGERALMKY
jgi:hypothetical protein